MSIFRKDRQEDTDEKRAQSLAQPEPDTAPGEVAMEEIYSTRTKKVKYKRQEPLAAEEAEKRQALTKEELRKGKLEFSAEKAPSMPEVELKSEPDPNAVMSDEIIEDVQDVRSLKGIYVQDVDDIDVSLDPMDSVREYEQQANDSERRDARAGTKPEENPYVYRGEKIVARVPAYRHESRDEKVFIKAGRFTDVVESEYDEYLKSTDPTVSQQYHALQKQINPRRSLLFTLSQMAQQRRADAEQQKSQDVMRENFDEDIEPKKKKRSKVGRFFHILGAIIADSIKSHTSQEDDLGDYNSREDEDYVMNKLLENRKKLAIHTAVFTLILAGAVTLDVLAGMGYFAGSSATLYCGIELILAAALGVTGYRYLFDGLRPLRSFKGNSDTAAALAYCACFIQSVVSVFTAPSFVDGTHHLYFFIAAFAMTLNAVGRLLMTVRVKRNFAFLTSRSPAYCAKIYTDEETARRMVSGTTTSKGIIAYQHITRFLSDFLKISYAPDPSEEMSGKLMPISLFVTAFVTVTYAVIFKSVEGAVSAMTVMLCISVPFTAMLAGNLPMLLFSKRMLNEEAMVAGYPSVRQFCDTGAIMMNSSELYPKGCVRLKELVPFQEFRVEDNLLMAAAVLKEAMSPIAPVFDDLIAENGDRLPTVESIMYEDKSGLVGWIGGERVLIGNMTLMNRYHISIPDDPRLATAKNRGREMTYIACAGRAIAALGLLYIAPKIGRDRMRKAEDSGLAFVISSPDPNVTAELISEQFGLFYRSVRIMPPGYLNEIDEVISRVEETSRAYLATRGRQTSLARAVGGCIEIKSDITLSIAIGIFGLVLGILLCATLALYATVARLSIVELSIYILFWTVSSLAAGLIRRP